MHQSLDDDDLKLEVERFSLSATLERMSNVGDWDPVKNSRLLVQTIAEFQRERPISPALIDQLRSWRIWAAEGGEVLQSTFMDWMHFTAWCRRKQAALRGDYRDWIAALLTAAYQDRTDRRLHAAVAPALRHGPEPSMRRTMALLEPHFPTILGTEGVLTMARALDFAERGAGGILNVFPFSCMPGLAVAAMAPRLRQRFDRLPWLDLSYEGQESTNIRTRLGAFMPQAARYALSRAC